jgi:hypothetical protein
MATWPSGTKASTANLDAGTDSPRLARADIKQNVDNVNSIIDMFNIDSPSANQVLKYNTGNARFELGTDDTGSAVSATTFVGDDSTGTAVNPGETFKIAGTQNITTAVSGDTMTITGPDLSSYLTSVAFGDLTSTPTTIAGYGITDAFDGAYASLTGTPTIPSLGDLTITNSTIQSSGDTIDLDDIVRFNVGYKEDINSLTSSTTIAVDATTAPVHSVTLGHNATFTISNMVAGQSIMIIITQDGTGTRTGSFTSVKFPGGAPTLSTGTGDIDVISVFYDGTNLLGNIAQDFTA